jgi:NADH dehydrogenase [ubiquinone] 1 alpha subcomplex assembly factor 5
MFATDTLFELRSSLLLAEQEREGGIGQHISPLTSMQDMGGLLTQSGFTLTTIDIDDIIVNYPSMFELMKDLKAMGESNAAWRRRSYLHRETLLAAAAIYQQMYGNEDGSIPATFRILFVIGWKPSQIQAQPAARGSATASLKDLKDLMNDAEQTH